MSNNNLSSDIEKLCLLVKRFRETESTKERESLLGEYFALQDKLVESGLDYPLGKAGEICDDIVSEAYAQMRYEYQIANESLIKDVASCTHVTMITIIGRIGNITFAWVRKNYKGRFLFSIIWLPGGKGDWPIGNTAIVFMLWLPPRFCIPGVGVSSGWIPIVKRKGKQVAVFFHPGLNYLPNSCPYEHGEFENMSARFVPVNHLKSLIPRENFFLSMISPCIWWWKRFRGIEE